MLQRYPWAVGLRIPNETIAAWESQAGHSELLRWAIANGKLPEFGYQEWAKSYYQLPSLNVEFFDKSPNPKLWEKWGSHNWSGTFLPIYEWEETLYIACLEPPDFEQAKLIETLGIKVGLVIAPMSGIKKWWHILAPHNTTQQNSSASGLPPELAAFSSGISGVPGSVEKKQVTYERNSKATEEQVVNFDRSAYQSSTDYTGSYQRSELAPVEVEIDNKKPQGPPVILKNQDHASSTLMDNTVVGFSLEPSLAESLAPSAPPQILDQAPPPMPNINLGLEVELAPEIPETPVVKKTEQDILTKVPSIPSEGHEQQFAPVELSIEDPSQTFEIDIGLPDGELGIPQESIVSFQVHKHDPSVPDDETKFFDLNAVAPEIETKELPEPGELEALELDESKSEDVAISQAEPSVQKQVEVPPSSELDLENLDISFDADGDELFLLDDEAEKPELPEDDSATASLEDETLEGFEEFNFDDDASDEVTSLEELELSDELTQTAKIELVSAVIPEEETKIPKSIVSLEVSSPKPPSPHLVDDEESEVPATAAKPIGKPFKVSHPEEAISDKLKENNEESSLTSMDSPEMLLAKNTLDQMSEYFERTMVLHMDALVLKPYFWQGSWSHNKNINVNIDLTMGSIFRIVSTSQKPYHGYVVRNQVNDIFFSAFNKGEISGHASLVPVLLNNSLMGVLMGFTDEQTGEKVELEKIEKIANEYAKKLVELSKSSQAKAA